MNGETTGSETPAVILGERSSTGIHRRTATALNDGSRPAPLRGLSRMTGFVGARPEAISDHLEPDVLRAFPERLAAERVEVLEP